MHNHQLKSYRFAMVAMVVTMVVVGQRSVPRAIASDRDGDNLLSLLVDAVGSANDDDQRQRDLLLGMQQGLRGQKNRQAPANWKPVYRQILAKKNPALTALADQVALILHDSLAEQKLIDIARDPHQPLEARRKALQSLAEQKAAGLPQLALPLLAEDAISHDALLSLFPYDDADIPPSVLAHYARWDHLRRQAVLELLGGRKSFLPPLLDAIEQGTVPRKDISTSSARRMAEVGGSAIHDRLTAVWGTLRAPDANVREKMTNYRKRLTNEMLRQADIAKGAEVFLRTCGQCHRLNGQGQTIGPDLTGSDRGNLDYLLENVLDPSAVIPKEYQVTNITTDDGRRIVGIVADETARTLTIRTVEAERIIDLEEIEERVLSDVSLMPVGQLDDLTPEQVRDLVGYLRTGAPGKGRAK
ncbi:MAG: c-type cytochrome [Pirellulaceae bacterium]|nr:c-type cytochrome [Planctomycetales bacterium]